MSERARNVAVGLTVLVALALTAGMILIFTGVPEIFQTGYDIQIRMKYTFDLHNGDPVHLGGMRVGRIREIYSYYLDPAWGEPNFPIAVVAKIDRGVRIPSNAQALIFSKGVTGGAYLSLQAEGPGKYPGDYLPTDGSACLEGISKGSGLFPEELMMGLKSLSSLADKLDKLLSPETEEGPPSTQPTATQGAQTALVPTGPPAPALKNTIVKMNRALDDIHTILGDPQNQANVKSAIANLAKAAAKADTAIQHLQKFIDDAGKLMTDGKALIQQAGKTLESIASTATRTGQGADELIKKLIDDAEKISALVSTFNRLLVKIDQGEGSLGKLLNDPKLYNGLVDATQQMNKLMAEFRQKLEEWSKNGLPMKLK
jgi:phospholipid/cholesterol/gamma-HCH transport system substrate-binding protein